MLQNAVELIEAVIADDELSGAFLRMSNADFRTEFLGNLDLEAPDIAVDRRDPFHRLACSTVLHVLDEFLGLADRQAFLYDLTSGVELLYRVRDRQQRPRVAHFDLAPLEQGLHFVRQVQQPQQVADRRSRSADGFGRFGMSQVKFTNKPVQRPRLFQRIEVFTLDILDKRQRDRRLVRDVPNYRRDLGETSQLRRTPATFTGNDLVTLNVASLP